MTKKYTTGQRIEVIVERYTPLGVVVSFNNDEALAYKEDIYEDLEIGQELIAYIKTIREDGKIDITFRKHGYKNFIGTTRELIMQVLKDNNGMLELNDKSTPEKIKEVLGISKSQFKKAIGNLYRERRIVIEEKGISIK